MVTIRRLCDKNDDVFSLRTVLRKAKEEKQEFEQQIDQLSGSLSKCDYVCTQVNKHVAHTANPGKSRNWKQWDMGMNHLDDARKAICKAAIDLDGILQWRCPDEIIPEEEDCFFEDLMLWVPERLRSTLHQAWHVNRERVNAWRLRSP